MIHARRSTLLLACTLLSIACPSGERRSNEIVVTYLEPTGAAARAGLRMDDRLLFFRRGAAPPANPRGATGQLASCADVAEVEIEQAPRGAVELELERGKSRLSFTLPPGEWKAGATSPLRDAGCADLAAARRARDAKKQAEAIAAYQRAERWAALAKRPLFRALALEEEAAIHLERNDFTPAERRLGESLRLRRQAAPDSLAEASSWHALGRLERLRGVNDRAEEHFRKALALRARLAPDSLERAFTLNNLGIVAWSRGEREKAGEIYQEALAIVRRRAPGGLEEAQVLNNLGLLRRSLGDLAAAEGFFNASNRILVRVDPNGTDLPRTLANLGAVAADRGNFALSESYHREAIARFRKVAPEGLEVATILFNLGWIASTRQDPQGAESLLRQSLAIRHRLAPGTLLEATTLSALANQGLATGRLDEARKLGEQAYALRSKLAPDLDDTAISIGILAKIALQKNDLDRAFRLASEEAEHQRVHGATRLHLGHSQTLLGNIAELRRDDATARRHFQAALDIYRAIEPRCTFTAIALSSLGRVERRSGHLDKADEDFRAALDALEGQIGNLGGSEEQVSAFEAAYLPLYQDLIDLQLARGDRAGALKTLERSRARGLLSLLSRRDLVFSADLPAPLRQRQARIDREYGTIQRGLAHLDGRRKGEEMEAGRAELERLRGERAALAEEIARASPRYAALRDPQPLGLAGIQATLDSGTVWLSYVLGANASHLFVVTRREMKVFPLATDRTAMAREVGIFRSLLMRGAEAPAVEGALHAQARRLYDLLVAPAEPWIGRAERILLSPDGALHTLPFGALVRGGASEGYLIDWKPLHSVVSATLYAELKARRRAAPPTPGLAAFADPVYPAQRGTPRPEDSPLRRYNLGLPPLPASRVEASSLAALYGSSARIFVGRAASERQATSLPPEVSIVHFASHALLDRHFPLDSALALSAPAGAEADSGEDGLLQAWEIFERLRLDADLVTLSACETGLGGAGGGEGLIGLTRAFQYAGARSILASLWPVSDRSTAELMKRFYTALRSGLPKDRALQAAQSALLHDRALGLSHPYHWAAFEMIGDWR